VHGGGGVTDDFPLALAWAHLRTLRLADGPGRGAQARDRPSGTTQVLRQACPVKPAAVKIAKVS